MCGVNLTNPMAKEPNCLGNGIRGSLTLPCYMRKSELTVSVNIFAEAIRLLIYIVEIFRQKSHSRP
jgi:hypothetical protein